jgi:hypothetical protein
MKKAPDACHWYKTHGRTKEGCQILTEKLCEKKGKCSFHETTVELQKRQEAFREKYGITKD